MHRLLMYRFLLMRSQMVMVMVMVMVVAQLHQAGYCMEADCRTVKHRD